MNFSGQNPVEFAPFIRYLSHEASMAFSFMFRFDALRGSEPNICLD